MRENPLLTAWSEGRVPRPPEGKRTRNGLILLAVLMAVLIAAFVLPILVSALDQFHPGSVRGISPGDTREQVMEQLGVTGSFPWWAAPLLCSIPYLLAALALFGAYAAPPCANSPCAREIC